MPTDSADGPWGELGDVVIDPVRRKVTHVVVQPRGRHDQARLVPAEAVASADKHLVLSWTAKQLEHAPRVEQTDYLALGEWPELDDGWEIGVSRILALPYYPGVGGPGLGMGMESDLMVDSEGPVTEVFDQIPQGTAEIRRASEVRTSDAHLVGHVEGFVVDPDDSISHLVLERGHLWGHREVTIPMNVVDGVKSDRVHLRVTKDDVGSFPAVPFRRHRHDP